MALLPYDSVAPWAHALRLIKSPRRLVLLMASSQALRCCLPRADRKLVQKVKIYSVYGQSNLSIIGVTSQTYPFWNYDIMIGCCWSKTHWLAILDKASSLYFTMKVLSQVNLMKQSKIQQSQLSDWLKIITWWLSSANHLALHPKTKYLAASIELIGQSEWVKILTGTFSSFHKAMFAWRASTDH